MKEAHAQTCSCSTCVQDSVRGSDEVTSALLPPSCHTLLISDPQSIIEEVEASSAGVVVKHRLPHQPTGCGSAVTHIG
eukprot:33809-Eustigmatos_ZCMA.PRE.1